MGKNTSEYKNLKINLEDIVGIINAWGLESDYEKVYVESPKDMRAKTLNYLVRCDDKIATVSIYPTKGGVCTVSPNFGKEKEISKEIADYIVLHSDKLADSNPYKNGLSLDLPRNEFEAFYALLKEQDNVVVDQERNDDKNKFFARLRNERYRDTIAISYYKTGKLLIQGKPFELFSLAVEILSGEYDLVKVINAETKSAELSVNSDDIIEDMMKSLGNAYSFLGNSQKAILASAYIFYRTNLAITGRDFLMDYSVLFHPASRVLEGYILKLLVNNNVLHDNGEGIGYYFRSESDSKPLTLYEQHVAIIDNDTISDEINRLYKLFHRLRHPYSHATENDFTTSIITKREVADSRFKEIIEAISSSYDVIASVKK